MAGLRMLIRFVPAVLRLGHASAAAIVVLAVGCSRQTSVASIEVDEKFQVELAASEPAVVDPVSITFDEHARMYVVEMIEYPVRLRDDAKPRSRVKLLEDLDGDGTYETWHVFLDGLLYPTSVLSWRGGVLVANPPDLLYCRDTNGDRRADEVTTLHKGFEIGNSQHNYNGLTYGIDSWVYASAGNVAEVEPADGSANPVSLGRRNFRLHPDTGVVEAYSLSAGGFGIAFDAWGRLFASHQSLHLMHSVIPDRYLVRNPALLLPTTLEPLSDHGSAARVYPISKPETRFNHPESSGYFSSVSGIAYYGGGAFPKEFNDSFFVGDVATNIVHRDVLRPVGATYTASRGRDGVEFLASRENWFRPVFLTTGPEGALYVADMHRAVIEHPEWIPDPIEKTLNLRAGDNKGRIYRVVPRGGLPRLKTTPAKVPLKELVEGLGHPNMWWRLTAQRLLIERRDPAAVPLLKRMLAESTVPLARLHLLWTLKSLGGLGDEEILLALEDQHPGVRENAVRLAEERLGEAAALRYRVQQMAKDAEPRVRFQVALSLGALGESADEALLEVARRDSEDRWARVAVVSSLAHREAPFLEKLFGVPLAKSPKAAEGRRELVQLVASTIATRGSDGAIADLLRLLDGAPARAEMMQAGLEGLARGLSRGQQMRPAGATTRRIVHSILEGAPARLMLPTWTVSSRLGLPRTAAQTRALTEAAILAADESQPAKVRAEQVGLLQFSDYSTHGKLILRFASATEPPAVQAAAMSVLDAWDDVDAVKAMLDRWRMLAQPVRRLLLPLILNNTSYHVLLIEVLEKDQLRFSEIGLNYDQRRRLLLRSTPDVQVRAAKLFSEQELGSPNGALKEFLSVSRMRGDPSRGMRHFERLCAKCHSLRGKGGQAGPDLSHSHSKSAETLLFDVLDPNRAIESQYISYLITRKNGTFVDGRILNETPGAVILVNEEGKELAVSRQEIESIASSGVSLMPEGLEKDFDRQGLADLIAYVQARPGPR